MGRERARHALLLALTLVGCDRAPAVESPPATPTTTPTKVVVPTADTVSGAAPVVPAMPAARATAAPTAPGDGRSTAIGGTATEPPTTGGRTTADPGGAQPIPSRKGARVPPDSPNATTQPDAPPPAPPQPAIPAPPPRTPPTPPSPTPPTPPTPPTAPAAAVAPTAPTAPAAPFTSRVLLAEKLFRVELAPLPPCKAAAACEAKVIVHALGGYKVNAEYPTKFVAKASPTVTVAGTGTFTVSGKTTGTMTIAFRAAAAGTTQIAGALKLSVCTDDVCEIAAPAIAFDVPVTAPR